MIPLSSILTILAVGVLTFMIRKQNRKEIQRTTEIKQEIQRVLDEVKDI